MSSHRQRGGGRRRRAQQFLIVTGPFNAVLDRSDDVVHLAGTVDVKQAECGGDDRLVRTGRIDGGRLQRPQRPAVADLAEREQCVVAQRPLLGGKRQ